jgi:hypothetical protein
LANQTYRGHLGSLTETLWRAQTVLEAAESWHEIFTALHGQTLTPDIEPIHKVWLLQRDEAEAALVKAVEEWQRG